MPKGSNEANNLIESAMKIDFILVTIIQLQYKPKPTRYYFNHFLHGNLTEMCQ